MVLRRFSPAWKVEDVHKFRIIECDELQKSGQQIESTSYICHDIFVLIQQANELGSEPIISEAQIWALTRVSCCRIAISNFAIVCGTESYWKKTSAPLRDTNVYHHVLFFHLLVALSRRVTLGWL